MTPTGGEDETMPEEADAHQEVRDQLVSFKAGPDDGLEEGQFIAYASVFGNKDSYGDVVMPGAFARTLHGGRSRATDPDAVRSQHERPRLQHRASVIKAEEDSVGLKVTAAARPGESEGAAGLPDAEGPPHQSDVVRLRRD
jgi:phage head maturation protease